MNATEYIQVLEKGLIPFMANTINIGYVYVLILINICAHAQKVVVEFCQKYNY